LRLAEQDIFANVVGGLQVEEPAIDLAVALALTSSLRDQSMPADLALVGEVGLSGEVRSVGQLEARLSEAARLGFQKAIIPRKLGRAPLEPPKGLEMIQVRSVRDAIDVALGSR
jgi:DNA repair protein RadA/Sms